MFHWSDEIYSVGIKKMDEQHKKLFGLLNVLEANRSSIDFEAIDKVFNTLILYTQNHFAEEIRFLQKIKYPGVSGHLAQHEGFVDSLKRRSGSSITFWLKIKLIQNTWISREPLYKADGARGRFKVFASPILNRNKRQRANILIANHRLIYLYFFRRVETAKPPGHLGDADTQWRVSGLRKL